jgi:hypothetical protein
MFIWLTKGLYFYVVTKYIEAQKERMLKKQMENGSHAKPWSWAESVRKGIV